MNQHNSNEPESARERVCLERRLRRFSAVRRHLLNAAVRYRLGFLAGLILAAGIATTSGWLGHPLADVLASLAVGVALLVLIGVAWRRRVRLRDEMNEAFFFEAVEGDLDSRLVSALDFLRRGLSGALPRAVIQRAMNDSERTPEVRLETGPRNLWRRRFLAGLAILLLTAANPWFGLARGIPNLRQAWVAVFNMMFPLHYQWTPDAETTIVRIGESIEVQLALAGRRYRQVEFLARRGDETRRTILTPDEQGRFTTSLTSAVEAEYDISFVLAGQELPARGVIFTREPELQNMQAELIYPAYTRMMPRTLEGVQTRLAALPGTRMALGFTFSKPLRSATFEWDDGETLPLDVVGRFAAVTLIHSRDRRATLRVVDHHGLVPDLAPTLDFAVQRDEPPRLFVPGHLTEDMPVTEEAAPLFGFGVRAEDDFGVSRCVLTWRQSTVDNPNQILHEGQLERLISPSQRRVVVAFEHIFEGLELRPGDRVGIEIAAYDNRMPDAQVTRSRPISLFVHQDDLGGLSLSDLGFSGGLSARQGRIGRARRSSTVAEPDATRTVEQLRVDWDAPLETSVVAPSVRGEHGEAVQDYFRLLSEVVFDDDEQEEKR